LLDFNENEIFLSDFRKIFKYKSSWKSLRWETLSPMRTDGHTATRKLIVAFRKFCECAYKLRTSTFPLKNPSRKQFSLPYQQSSFSSPPPPPLRHFV
jgi:hypothetical protein